MCVARTNQFMFGNLMASHPVPNHLWFNERAMARCTQLRAWHLMSHEWELVGKLVVNHPSPACMAHNCVDGTQYMHFSFMESSSSITPCPVSTTWPHTHDANLVVYKMSIPTSPPQATQHNHAWELDGKLVVNTWELDSNIHILQRC